MKRLLLFALTGVALAQNGSIEGVVVDSASQGPVRKAQVILMYRGAPPAVAIPQGSMGGGGGRIGAVIVDPAGISSGRAAAGIMSAGVMSAAAPGARFGPAGAPHQPTTAASDSAGSFAFRDLAPGRYAVQAMHPRFPMRPGGLMGTDVEVKPGETARVNIALTPGASMTGRIVDEDGEPLQGCMVQLRSATERQPWGGAMGMEMSNERGEYRLYGVQPGRYLAFALCGRPAFQPRPFSAGPPPPPNFGYPPVYYPQASDSSAATPIDLTAGNERSGVDFQVKPARVYTVTGTLSGFEKQPNRQLMVNLTQTQEQAPSMQRAARVNPETGTFQIQNVFAGSYVVVATQFSPEPNGGMLSARQPVEVTDRPTHLNLVLQKPVDIPGTFAIEGSQDLPKQQIGLVVTPEEQAGPMQPPRVEPQSDGSFLMRNTSQGRWQLQIFGPNVYLRAVEANGQTLPGNVLDTTVGGVTSLRVVVSTRTATVQGRGLPGNMYSLLRDEGDRGPIRPHIGHADPQGVVRIIGVPPGKYGVYKGPNPDESQRIDTITLAEEATAEVDFTKEPGR